MLTGKACLADILRAETDAVIIHGPFDVPNRVVPCVGHPGCYQLVSLSNFQTSEMLVHVLVRTCIINANPLNQLE